MKNKVMIFLLVTTVIMGLTAGIFYCWSCSVTVGLAPLPDKEYLAAFQSLNRKIINPLFMCCFLGSALLLPISTFIQYAQPVPVRFWLLLGASIAYIGGVIVVTFAGNIPLNNMLDAFNINTASTTEITQLRTRFEIPWNRLNNIRTIACIIALTLTILACLDKTVITT